MNPITSFSKKRNISLSVIIPSFNEEKRIGKTISRILSYLKKKRFNYEIIIVDDGSKDNTRNIVKKFLKNKNIILTKKRENKGKGYSVKQGALIAKHNFILFSDADLSTPIQELDKFLKYIDKYDIVIGSRALKGADIRIKQPFYRAFIGKTFNKIARLLTVKGIKDTQCGFKLFKNCRDIFKKQTIDGFGFDVELLFISQKRGLKIKELPITWLNAEGSKVSAFKDSCKMFYDLLKIRFNSILGKY
jgi:dolichyl-phosphate beta-glucosyltransferase